MIGVGDVEMANPSILEPCDEEPTCSERYPKACARTVIKTEASRRTAGELSSVGYGQ